MNPIRSLSLYALPAACLLLAACAAPTAPEPDLSTEARWRPRVRITPPPTVTEGVATDLFVEVADNARLVTVVVFASPTLGNGPCDPRTGLCLDLAQPTEIGRYNTRARDAQLPWTPPAAGAAHLQAVVLRQGRSAVVSDVVTVQIQPPIAGCTWFASPNYNPAATVEDGSCDCPPELVVTSAAELAPFLSCPILGRVEIYGDQGSALALSALESVDTLYIASDAGRIELPALRTFRGIAISENPNLRAISLTNIDTGGALELTDNPELDTIQLNTRGALEELLVSFNRSLSSLDLSDVTVTRWLILEVNDRLSFVATGPMPPEAGLALGWTSSVPSFDFSRSPDLGGLYLSALDLPNLPPLPGNLQRLYLAGLASLRQLDLSNTTLTAVTMTQMYDLTALRLPSSGELSSLNLTQNPALRTVDASQLSIVDEALIAQNPVLQALDMPVSLGACDTVELTDNPSLCVTNVPALVSPPPGCAVTGTGNACDP